MGFGGISLWQLIIILVIVILLFGTKKLKNLGSDLGSAIKGFKNSVSDENINKDETLSESTSEQKDADFAVTDDQKQSSKE